MIARRPEKPDRSKSEDRTPTNILKRPLRLPPMKRIQEEADGCTCNKPISFHHVDGMISCVRCRRRVEEARA